MRKLVGGKYLEMLHVSDTIDSMSREFAGVSQSVQSLLSVKCGFLWTLDM